MLQAYLTNDKRVIFTESNKANIVEMVVTDGTKVIELELSRQDFKDIMSLTYTLKFKDIPETTNCPAAPDDPF